MMRMADSLSDMNKTQRFDIVLLDADETIFDFKKAEAYALQKMLERFSVPCDDDKIRLYSSINLKLWKALERSEVTRERLQSIRFEQFFEQIGVNDIDPLLANDCYLTNLSDATILIDGAEEFVKELHKYCRIYMATNGLTKAQTGRFSKSAISEYIDGAFISEQIGYTKPDKEYFEFIFKQLNVCDKSRVVIIGDSLTSDMQGGRNAGITTCLYSRSGEHIDSHLCDYQIRCFSDFFDILFE